MRCGLFSGRSWAATTRSPLASTATQTNSIPIFWEGPEGHVIASDWAGGFLDAVAMRPEAWKVLMGDEDAGMLMVPLLLLNGDFEFDGGVANEDAFLAEAPDIIPTCIAGIHEFWKSHQKPVIINVARSRRRVRGHRRG